MVIDYLVIDFKALSYNILIWINIRIKFITRLKLYIFSN